MRRLSLALATASCAVAGSATPARAEAPSDGSTTTTSAPAIAPRPWLYLDDPSLPAPLHAVAVSRATYTGGASPTRPFGANLARPGAVVEMGGEVGLLPQFSVVASAFGGGLNPGVGALAGIRFAPFERVWPTTHVVVSAGWLHELNGASGDGAWLRMAVAQDIARLRLGATVHGEHVFAAGRDAVDVLVMAGASYALAGPLRAGIEYVAQDIEETFADQAERGLRQFIGPDVAFELLTKRLSVVAGPAIGLGPQSPTYSGRMSLAYEY